MFTGIVHACFPITDVVRKPGLVRITIQFPKSFVQTLETKTSVAVDGVCLTVVKIENACVSFDLMEETLRRTTLGDVEVGRLVNVERSARFGDEIGGHFVSGHVTGMGEIVAIDNPENNHVMTFKLPKQMVQYIFKKGFVALDGVSLTVVDVDREACTFTVWFIPETLRLTDFGYKKVGDKINVEIDSRTQTIVETIKQTLKNNF